MKHFIFTILLLFFGLTLCAQDRALYVEYNKHQDDHALEIASVYFDSFIGMYLLVREPVLQYVNMNPESYVYYYPNEKMAMIMNNRDGVLASAPLQLFSYSGSEDMGISGLGFKFSKHYFKSDTLVKVWELEGKKKNEYLRIEAYHSQKHLLKTLSYNNENELMKQVEFSDWLEVKNYKYPMSIEIQEAGKKSLYNFSNLSVIENIPDSVKQTFKIPEDCVVHEYKW